MTFSDEGFLGILRVKNQPRLGDSKIIKKKKQKKRTRHVSKVHKSPQPLDP